MSCELVCSFCGVEFVAKSKRLKFCSNACREEARRESVNKSKRKTRKEQHKKETASVKAATSVEDVIGWIQNYYKKTGILLSYGKAVAKIEQEKGQNKNEKKNQGDHQRAREKATQRERFKQVGKPPKDSRRQH